MDKIDEVLDYVREAAGIAKKKEKSANLIALILVIVGAVAVVAVVAVVLYKFMSPKCKDIDDFEDEFNDDDDDDFFEDEEEDTVQVKPEPVVTKTEEIVSEK